MLTTTPSEHTEPGAGLAHGGKPEIGRNEPCPCGSGKKYKKCCLASDETTARVQAAAARAQAMAEAAAAEAARQAAHLAHQEQLVREWEERRQKLLSPEETATESKELREPDLPPLAPEDQLLVNDWWTEVGPVYTGKSSKDKCGWLLERTLAFLDQQPQLFRYLNLHEEFLFELCGALARAGRRDDFLALLRRLRCEEPLTYFQCFGYFDQDLITEALRTGHHEEIPAYLDLFRQHPVKHIDQFAEVVRLLAWCGCESELRGLLTPTAQTIADSPDVFGGDFGLYWLAHLAMVPFLAAGDDSTKSVDEICQAIETVDSWANDRETEKRLRRAVRMASRAPAEAGLDLKKSKGEWFEEDVGWNFAGWLLRSKGLNWTSARFLANSLLEYWGWEEAAKKKKKGASPFGLDEIRLDHYLARRCGGFLGFKGLPALSTLQAFHYFTEYLVSHDYFSEAEARRLQSAAAELFEVIRGAVDIQDSAYLLYPTYPALIAGGEAAPRHSAVAPVVTPMVG